MQAVYIRSASSEFLVLFEALFDSKCFCRIALPRLLTYVNLCVNEGRKFLMHKRRWYLDLGIFYFKDLMRSPLIVIYNSFVNTRTTFLFLKFNVKVPTLKCGYTLHLTFIEISYNLRALILHWVSTSFLYISFILYLE